MGSISDDEAACIYAMQLAAAAVLPMTLKNAIELGMIEILVGAGGKMLSPSEVAAQLPSTANAEAPAIVDRMLRLLASHNVVSCEVEEGKDGRLARRYGTAPVCKWLSPDEDGVSLAPMVLLNDKVMLESWYHLKDTVLNGGLPFEKAYGMTAFDYQGTDPRFNRVFNEAMKTHSMIITKKLLEFYKGFDGVGTLVDVGGGVGATIHTILCRYPSIEGVNFDLPHVISEAPSFAGVHHIGGDMFKKVPSGDAILMKWILHDWNDEHCTTLLSNCYDALPAHGKVVIVEYILPVKPDETATAQRSFEADMIMLTHTPGGKERYLREYEELARSAGFASVKATYVYSNIWVIELNK
ncbi:hypothetical protein CFC21_080483 [Triticum aestivum]|uniref:Caffeic acid 3-O-methyltransferase n=5 Tax=Triticinae TaxID=1648030 RepID=A0A453M983_AEGTS|nr:tricetin 3',4',5'-O-trimethyltransferase [Aegilops tauschii subsp. strangulata]XP_044399923.1 tricetin 3',4',5'-O-trimethyltransferase-like [Triticum aestivum]KAF7075728.1 hypothetical protein CFC21_080483 [Triticum aestivum]UPL51480.1 O-methyltransferase 8 [Triticum aestivum]